MNLPRQWSVLNFVNTDKAFYFGVDYTPSDRDQLAPQPCHYCIYITDYYYTWLCDVDEFKIKAQALSRGIDTSQVGRVYELLVDCFQNLFKGDEFALTLEQSKYDHGVPLDMKIKMSKTLPNQSRPFVWDFELGRLPDSSTISIFRNLDFYNVTVIYAMIDYIGALQKEIEGRDNIIRISKENMDPTTAKILNSGSNSRFARKFDSEKFDHEWASKSLASFQGKDIWDDFLPGLHSKNHHIFGSKFTDKNVANALRRKRLTDDDDDEHKTDDRSMGSPTKKSKPNIEKLSGNLETDLKLNADAENDMKSKSATASPTNSSKSTSGSPSPKKEKKRVNGFGVSQKRKAHQRTYSPIKAPRI